MKRYKHQRGMRPEDIGEKLPGGLVRCLRCGQNGRVGSHGPRPCERARLQLEIALRGIDAKERDMERVGYQWRFLGSLFELENIPTDLIERFDSDGAWKSTELVMARFAPRWAVRVSLLNMTVANRRKLIRFVLDNNLGESLSAQLRLGGLDILLDTFAVRAFAPERVPIRRSRDTH